MTGWVEDQFVPALAAHKVIAPIDIYPLMEHRKRTVRGMSRPITSRILVKS